MASRLAFWRREVEDAASDEAHPKPGLLSDFILGSQDGLVNVLGVILGVAIASYKYPNPITIILAGGLAAAFAESISMGAVAYTSTIARRDHYQSEVDRELLEMKQLPDVEREEVRKVFAEWGYSGKDLEDLTDRIVANPKAWLEFMMAHELKLAPVDKTQARKSAVLVGVAAIIGSIIPLLPFFAYRGGASQEDIRTGIVVSLVLSSITLFVIGWYKGRTTIGRPFRSGTQMLIIGIVSALAGFGIAYLVGGSQ